MTSDLDGSRAPVVDWLAVAAERRPLHPFIEQDGSSWSFSWCNHRASRIAGALHALGVAEGSRVAVWGANDLDTILAIFAIPRAGATLVPLNTRLTADEVERQLHAADVSLILRSPQAPPFPLRLSQTLSIATLDGMPLSQDWHDPEKEFAVVFTTGTSGVAKGVRLAWRALEASAAASAEHLGHDENDRWYAVLPLYHIGGISILVRSARQGSTVVLGSKFDDYPMSLTLSRCTIASMVSTHLVRLLNEEFEDDLSGLKAILLGGGPVPPGLIEMAIARRLPVLVTYGQTEAASQIATAPIDVPGLRRARPLMGMEVRIVDESGVELPPGVVGRIEVRGPELFSGYIHGTTRDPNEWHRTGDLGEVDWDGLLAVRERVDRVIVSGGENVHPREVEDALVEAGALEACVVGLPDPKWGQVVAAAVVGPVSPADLEFAIRGFLAGYKVPRRWLAVEELPRNALGKVLAAEVAELFTG